MTEPIDAAPPAGPSREEMIAAIQEAMPNLSTALLDTLSDDQVKEILATVLDNTKEAVAYHRRKCEAHDRYRKIVNSNSDRERRTELLNIRSQMSKEQKERFAAGLADRVGDKAAADPVAAINKMTGEYEFKRVAEFAVKILYDISTSRYDEDDDERYYY